MTTNHLSRRGMLKATAAVAFLGATGGVLGLARAVRADEGIFIIPTAKTDPANSAKSDVAVLAGGCFWGVQGVYQHVKGVTNAVSGYTGGIKTQAEYETVSSGVTDHAESVEITYDPAQISYGEILHIFFSVVHDPTQLNRQGPDHGRQYRSAIFPRTAQQADTAKAYIDQLNQARIYKAAIVTKIEKDKEFFPAERYHQDYMTENPRQPYIAYNDIPKVIALGKTFPERFRSDPVLVKAKGGPVAG